MRNPLDKILFACAVLAGCAGATVSEQVRTHDRNDGGCILSETFRITDTKAVRRNNMQMGNKARINKGQEQGVRRGNEEILRFVL